MTQSQFYTQPTQLRPPRHAPVSPAGPSAPIRHRAPPARVYVAAWLLVGAAALVYMLALLARPELVAGGGRAGSSGESQDIARALSRVTTDVAALQRNMGDIDGEVAQLKSTATAVDARERGLAERIGVVESRLESFAPSQPLTASAPVRAQPKVSARSAAVVPPVPTASTISTASLPAPPETAAIESPAAVAVEPPQPRLLNGPSSMALAMAGTARPTAAARAASIELAPQPVQAQVRKAFGIQLSTGPSVDSLRLSWNLIVDKNRALLKPLEPRAATVDGQVYQLIAGPFASDADAQKACAGLRSRGFSCRPAEFAGEAL